MSLFFRSNPQQGGGGLPTQEKNNEVAKTTPLVVTPDEGYVLSKVTVAPTPSEPGSGTAPLSGTSPFTPTEGKYFSSFTVTATPSKSDYEITAGTSDKTITLPSGKLISGGTVHPTPSSSKEWTATTETYHDVTPNSGELLSKVRVYPQKHTDTTPVAIATRTTSYDLGEVHNKRYISTNGVPNSHSGNRSSAITANTDSLDLGADHTFRYVKVSVPNSHSGSRSSAITANNSNFDLGADHTYRYVNINVPNSHTDTTPKAITTRTSSYDLGASHNYRYISTQNVPSGYNSDWTVLWTGNKNYGTFSYTYSTAAIPSGWTLVFRITYKERSTDTNVKNAYCTLNQMIALTINDNDPDQIKISPIICGESSAKCFYPRYRNGDIVIEEDFSWLCILSISYNFFKF